MTLTLNAILWLVPWLDLRAATSYAQAMDRSAKVYRIDPLLVVAIAYKESRFRPSRVSRGNYGLLQVRVSRTTHKRFLGQEFRVLDPRLNISLGVAMLARLRQYHSYCRTRHHWWAHYQWGLRVGNNQSGERVGAVYRQLVWRFRNAFPGS